MIHSSSVFIVRVWQLGRLRVLGGCDRTAVGDGDWSKLGGGTMSYGGWAADGGEGCECGN